MSESDNTDTLLHSLDHQWNKELTKKDPSLLLAYSRAVCSRFTTTVILTVSLLIHHEGSHRNNPSRLQLLAHALHRLPRRHPSLKFDGCPARLRDGRPLGSVGHLSPPYALPRTQAWPNH